MYHFTRLLKPKTLDDIIGQTHLFSHNAPLRRLIDSKSIPHCIFFGPPGSGKTSAAFLIASSLQSPFQSFNATTLKIEDIRAFLKNFTHCLEKPLIFIDEIHRLSKNQEEVLLPFMEYEEIMLIGASTQNPYHQLTQAFRSRSMLFEFQPLSTQQLKQLFLKAQQLIDFSIEDQALEYLIFSSGGDARGMLNLLDCALTASSNQHVDLKTLKHFRSHSLTQGSNEANCHYDLASAFIKSLRGSDENAAIYYLALWLKEGEDVGFIARRMVIFASEDIGNANPQALLLATATLTAVSSIGMPEARIILAQCAIYLAACPKSNSAYQAINEAIIYTDKHPPLPIPPYLKAHHKEYRYPHDFGGWVQQNYLSHPLYFVKLKGVGYEKTLLEWLQKIKSVR